MIRYDQPFVGDSGEFYVPDTRCYFTFRPASEPWAAKHEFIHAIDVLDGVRFGIVRKTVAYVCVDEDRFGLPIIEKWNITKRNSYRETV